MTVGLDNVITGAALVVNQTVNVTYPQPAGGVNAPQEPTDLIPLFETANGYINDFDLGAASRLLSRLESEHGHRFQSFTWFRFYSLRGHLRRLRGDNQGAARDFLQAKQAQPETEASAHLEIFAHVLFGQIDIASNTGDRRTSPTITTLESFASVRARVSAGSVVGSAGTAVARASGSSVFLSRPTRHARAVSDEPRIQLLGPRAYPGRIRRWRRERGSSATAGARR